jgi:glycosyltransferase involved in cell wall biosynthesis
MKIAIVSTYPPKKCGIGIYTKRLATAFSKHGIVRVISFKNFDYKDKIVVPILGKNNIFSYFKAADYIKKQGFDKVLIEYEYLFYNPFFFLIFLLLLKIKKTKINLEMHTVVPYTDFVKKNIFTLYHSLMLLFVDKVIMHTKTAEKKLVARTLVKKPIVIFPMPIPVKKIKAKKSKNKQKTLVCFGFVAIDKGLDIALKAFGGMKGVTLKIIGTVNPASMKKQHDYYDRIKEMAKQFDNVVIIDRFVSDKEKQWFFDEADFFILPYRFIEQSAILTDVWSCAKIPICSDIKPLKEQVGGKNGVLFKSEDPGDLRRKFISINNDKKRQRTIINNIKKLVKQRSFDSVAEKFMGLLTGHKHRS